jgi:hypothetical protein
MNTAVDVLRRDVRGYGALNQIFRNVYLDRGKVSYALLPVYLLSTKYGGKDYLFAMNGQTGKFVGDLPLDKKAMWKWFFGIAGAVSAACFAVSYLMWLL